MHKQIATKTRTSNPAIIFISLIMGAILGGSGLLMIFGADLGQMVGTGLKMMNQNPVFGTGMVMVTGFGSFLWNAGLLAVGSFVGAIFAGFAGLIYVGLNSNSSEITYLTQEEANALESRERSANSGPRLIAFLIDGFIIAIITSVFVGMCEFWQLDKSIRNAGTSLLTPSYFVFFTFKFKQTAGKKLMDMKVSSRSPNSELTFVQVVLREIVGKFISSAVLMLGYIWGFVSHDKLTWHDYIGNTKVIKTK